MQGSTEWGPVSANFPLEEALTISFLQLSFTKDTSRDGRGYNSSLNSVYHCRTWTLAISVWSP